jgi:hypothetical protein
LLNFDEGGKKRREVPMTHTEAVEQLASERYLLDELAPDAREAFEEHFFDCRECALDLRSSALFIDEAKAELSRIPSQAAVREEAPKSKSGSWLSWLRPSFAMPAFAALLAVVVFQNTVTFPSLRQAATQPRLAPLVHLRPATRGGDHFTVTADRVHGAALQVDFAEPGEIAAQSYAIELRDSQDKLVWTTTAPAQDRAANQVAGDRDQQFSLYLPGAKLRNGAYSLKITGVDAAGQRSPMEEYRFDIVVVGQ